MRESNRSKSSIAHRRVVEIDQGFAAQWPRIVNADLYQEVVWMLPVNQRLAIGSLSGLESSG